MQYIPCHTYAEKSTYFHCIGTDFRHSATVNLSLALQYAFQNAIPNTTEKVAYHLFEKYVVVWHASLLWCMLKTLKKQNTIKWKDLSSKDQYKAMAGMKRWWWWLLTCARHPPETCRRHVRGKGSQTGLPPWAVFHKALYFYVKCAEVPSHSGSCLGKPSRGLKFKSKKKTKPWREGFHATGSQKAPTWVTAFLPLRSFS